MQKELEDAAKDTRGLSPDSVPLNSIGPVLLCGALPSNPAIKFVRLNMLIITFLGLRSEFVHLIHIAISIFLLIGPCYTIVMH